MRLTKHDTGTTPTWALNGAYLPLGFELTNLLAMSQSSAIEFLSAIETGAPATAPLLAPIATHHEVWASGVTYLRSRNARQAESNVADVYERVYDADRPELFFKALGWRVVGSNQRVRIRKDSQWNVPEPELTLVINAHSEIVGYCAGNDMSSRSIEGANPLYLPQAKSYRGSCALGDAIYLSENESLSQLVIKLQIERKSQATFAAETSIKNMKRQPAELVSWLFRELDFPEGVFLMTGTGIVPEDDFTLQSQDKIQIQVGQATLTNIVDAD